MEIRYQNADDAKSYNTSRSNVIFDNVAVANYIRNPKPKKDSETKVKRPKKRKVTNVLLSPKEQKEEKDRQRKKRMSQAEKERKIQESQSLLSSLHPHSIRIFTDGACKKNPGPAACAAHASFFTPSMKKPLILERVAPLGISTNNVAELKAVELGLDLLEDFEEQQHQKITNADFKYIYILPDSSYAVGVLAQSWNAQCNKDLIERIQTRLQEWSKRIPVLFYHINAHVGIAENERVDELATEACEQIKKTEASASSSSSSSSSSSTSASSLPQSIWVQVLDGDIRDAKETYIIHQNNCRTYQAHGVADVLFQRFPYANAYKDRTKPSTPGMKFIFG